LELYTAGYGAIPIEIIGSGPVKKSPDPQHYFRSHPALLAIKIVYSFERKETQDSATKRLVDLNTKKFKKTGHCSAVL
jgi:hypothetical protein